MENIAPQMASDKQDSRGKFWPGLASGEKKNRHGRYALLDTIRGAAIISMILFHGVWNLVYLYDVPWQWYKGVWAQVLWQESICWTFLLLSGFCFSMGKRQLRNGLLVFGCGLLVTAATSLLLPQTRVVCGILTCIGSCMLLAIPIDRAVRGFCPAAFVISFLFFFFTYPVNAGYAGLKRWKLALPESWYQGLFAAWLGFTPADFYSTDYFPILPWFFLFLTGYFLYPLFQRKGWLGSALFSRRIPALAFLGRHSLLIYLVHQPVLYGVMGMVFRT